MIQPDRLKLDGLVEQPLELGFEDLAQFPESAHIRDVSRYHPQRKGDGVLFRAILERARPLPEANYITLHADRDDFHVSIPLAPVRSEGIVVYQQNGLALAVEQGGPVRFLIKNPSVCQTGELDECANVKYLSRIEITVRRGRDTRPQDEAAHAELHRSQAAETL